MEILILVISAFITSAISAVIGMGGGIILLGIMAIVLPNGYLVIALHGIIQLISNSTRTFIFKNHIKKELIKQFSFGALFGAILSGLIIFLLINFYEVQSAKDIKFDFLKPLIGLFIIWYLFFKKNNKEIISKSFVKVGVISGLASVFIGATGPLIAPFFLKSKLTKQNIIANKAACQMVTHCTKIPLFMFFFDVNYFNEYKLLIPLMFSVLIGTKFGKYLLAMIPEKLFKKIFKLTLFIISIKLIINI